MAGRVIREERRQRGVFGWIFLILFWAFNAFMLYALVSGMAAVNDLPQADTEAGRAGQAIGVGIGVTMILGIWLFGAIILGLFVLFTRGKTVIVEVAPAGVVASRDVDTSGWSKKDREAYQSSLRGRSEPLVITPPKSAPLPQPPSRPGTSLPRQLQSGDAWDIELAGEESYQDAIADALQSAKVHDDLYLVLTTLEPEGASAVRVAFRGRTVGYLLEDAAREYREELGRVAGSAAGAVFSSPAGSYQIWLSLAWPPRFK